MQLLLAPCGLFMARALPHWGMNIHGTRHSLNPGAWSAREQIFATIIFSVANNAGATYYTLLVQRLPQYLDLTWITFGYEIAIALSTQMLGLGLAGILRRFFIYLITAVFPKVLPTSALNRALILTINNNKVINGWTLSRYNFLMACLALMFIWYWIPNYFFQALRSFDKLFQILIQLNLINAHLEMLIPGMARIQVLWIRSACSLLRFPLL
jgi:hypothetical protein